MGWQDDFGLVSQALGHNKVQPPKSYTTWDTRLRQAGFGSSFGGSGGGGAGVTWNDLASGRLTTPRPSSATTPAAPPEKFQLPSPYSANGQSFSAAPKAPAPETPHSTQGDLFGSLLAAGSSTVGNLNLGNAIPWFMERLNVLADEATAAGVPGAAVGKAGLDVFSSGVKAASDVIAPVLDAFPNFVRDGQLHDRAKLYRAMVTGASADFGFGAVSNPLATIGQLAPLLTSAGANAGALFDPGARNPLTDTFGRTVTAENNEYEQYRQMLLKSVDPNARATSEQRLGILKEAIDIPQSVKIAIERNPTMSDADIEKAIANAPEGRQWSYQAGIPGMARNLVTPLVFYGAEARGIGMVAPALGAAGAGSSIPGVASLTAGAGRAVSVAAALQKYSTVAGLGTTALTTAMDGISRWQGNQAAIDWFDRVNRTTKFSDDPNVQLVTGFSVNPLEAIKTTVRLPGKAVSVVGAATKSARELVTLPLAKGLGEIPIAASLGKRMTTFVSSDTAMLGMIQRMYKLPDEASASAFVDQHYQQRGQAFDEVLGVALDEVLDRLPKAERATINGSFQDPIERTKFVMQTYGEQAMTLLEKDPAGVAARWQARSFLHHGYAGGFDADVAAQNASDYRSGAAKTYTLRAEMDAVLGYREAFPPQAQALASAQLDGMTAADGTIAVKGSNGVNDLIRQFPVLRKSWSGLITNETRVPRATVDRILERATADWQRLTKQNPIRARTGADPILRPNSPTLTRDTAEALGTTQETLNAIHDPAVTADGISSIRRFLADKTAMTPDQVNGLSDADAIQTAQRYVADTTKPWSDLGTSVVAAEGQMTNVRAELVRLRAMPKYAAQKDEIVRAEREYAALQTLIRGASDPVTPFATEVAHDKPAARIEGRDIHLTELAVRRAEATTRLNDLYVIHDAGAALAGDDWHSLFRLVEGEALYSGGLPAVSTAVRRALRLPHMGDFEAWSTIGNNLDRMEHLLTKAQRRRVHQVLDDGRWKSASPAERIRGGDVANGVTSDSAGETLARLWSERNGILAGTSEYALRRTAELNLPREYAAMADDMVNSGTTERAIVNDPRFERVIHPANVARLQDALATPETFPAVRDIINSDPVLTERFLKFLNSEGYLSLNSPHEIVVPPVPPARFGRDARGNATVPTSFRSEPGYVYRTVSESRAQSAWRVGEYAAGHPATIYAESDRSVVLRTKDNGNFEAATSGVNASDNVRAMGVVSPNDVEMLGADGSWVPVVDRQVHGTYDLGITDPSAPEVMFSTTFDVLGDAAEAPMIAEAMIPKDFVRPTPGVIIPSGAWDQALLSNDKGALEGLARDMKQHIDETVTEPTAAPARVASRAATKVPRSRPSTRYIRKLAEADGTAAPASSVLEAPGNRIGLDVLSVMNHGITGTVPATINGVVRLLRAIENGDARRAGIGPDLAAEGQRVANEILDVAVKEAPKPDTTGIFTKGVLPDDELRLAGEINHLLTYDDADPLGTLQYGLKKRPKAAVVLEMSQVPGLSEELMAGRFQPYEERVWNTHAREAFNYVFGARSNAAIRAEAKVRFLERAGQDGVGADIAAAVHDAWAKMSKESRSPVERKTPTGEYRFVSGDNPLYADVHNIPNASLQAVAHKTIDELYGSGKIDNLDGYLSQLHKVNYADLFRESSSFTRRALVDHGGPLGDALARTYGMAVHNKAVTTAYYWFRFGLDIRYHAMNYLEAQILYYGRAGLKKGEISQGYLGQTEEYLRNLDSNPSSNTGYPLSHDRMAWAYRTFLKEQPDAMRGALKGLDSEDPAFTGRFLDQLARTDPQIADMRKQFGDDPTKYLAELDHWHGKMLNNASLDEDAKVIDQSIADALRQSPDLAEVYAKLGEVNKGLWDDVRGTFYGNPDRSRAERFLNSYLLFWPLSYQLKATKWLAKVMFDSAGGLPTNAAGAVLIDRMATTHQQLIATDPQYQGWFEKHPTLMFLAQMLFPIAPDSAGVSLSPIMRDLFFERNKALWDVGPVYTFNHVVPQVGNEVYADVYPLLKDVPGFDGLYRAITGKQEPKPPAVTPPAPTP